MSEHNPEPTLSETKALMVEWAKSRGLTLNRKPISWRGLFDGRTKAGGAARVQRPPVFGSVNPYPWDLFPGEDHACMFDKDGKPAIFVFQPYHLDLEQLRGIVNTCDAYNLDVSISTQPAWHYPGHVLFVEIEIRGAMTTMSEEKSEC